MKPIRFSAHSSEQLFFRGTSEEEVIETINTASWQSAEMERIECRKKIHFGNEWNKKYYQKKVVRPIFIEESGEIVVITVYTYFF